MRKTETAVLRPDLRNPLPEARGCANSRHGFQGNSKARIRISALFGDVGKRHCLVDKRILYGEVLKHF
jgi:hypothetical protein